MFTNGEFTAPFHVKDGVIYDHDKKKVKLWGVNYYAPFNHNYYNIEELGKDHFAAIDEDIRHLKNLVSTLSACSCTNARLPTGKATLSKTTT